jgi:hypothetical protein
MAIQQIAPPAETPEQVRQIAQKLVEGLGNSAKDFEHASKQYNSVFFNDEAPLFRQEVCLALHKHFSAAGFENLFWKKFGVPTDASYL